MKQSMLFVKIFSLVTPFPKGPGVISGPLRVIVLSFGTNYLYYLIIDTLCTGELTTTGSKNVYGKLVET